MSTSISYESRKKRVKEYVYEKAKQLGLKVLYKDDFFAEGWILCKEHPIQKQETIGFVRKKVITKTVIRREQCLAVAPRGYQHFEIISSSVEWNKEAQKMAKDFRQIMMADLIDLTLQADKITIN